MRNTEFCAEKKKERWCSIFISVINPYPANVENIVSS